MKRLLTTVLSVTLAAVSAAPGQSMGVRTAVIEFTPGPQAAGMTHEAKRHLQASIANSLHKTRKYHVVDVRHTREASQSILAAVNNDSSTDAAVKLGKQLGVAYVLTGLVTDYTPNGRDGHGHATLRPRLVEVATGAVKYSGEIAETGKSAQRPDGTAEMQAYVLKPAIEKLTEALAGK